MEAIAKFDFNASGEDELSFQARDVLKVCINQHVFKDISRTSPFFIPQILKSSLKLTNNYLHCQ